MEVTIINFSGRRGGSGEAIARAAAEHYSAHSVEVFSFAELQISPCGRCGYECLAGSGDCRYSPDDEKTLCEAIVRSGLALFIIPNYCDYPCSNYFVFNERSLSFFTGRQELLESYLRVRKKFVVLSNTEEDNFRRILSQQTAGEPDILFLSGRRLGLASSREQILSSPEAARELRRFFER